MIVAPGRRTLFKRFACLVIAASLPPPESLLAVDTALPPSSSFEVTFSEASLGLVLDLTPTSQGDRVQVRACPRAKGGPQRPPLVPTHHACSPTTATATTATVAAAATTTTAERHPPPATRHHHHSYHHYHHHLPPPHSPPHTTALRSRGWCQNRPQPARASPPWPTWTESAARARGACP